MSRSPRKRCIVVGCESPHSSHGFCKNHEYSFARYGDPLEVQRKRQERLNYMLAHMHDDCPKWPYGRNTTGYGHIVHDGKLRLVHRIVCELTHGAAPSHAHVSAHSCGLGHLGCFGANCVRWATVKENFADRIAHGTANRGDRCNFSKLSEPQVLEIKELLGEGLSQTKIAAKFGVHQSNISLIASGKTWECAGHG